MKTMEELLAHAADEVDDKIAQVPARSAGTVAGSSRTSRLIKLVVFSTILISLGAVIALNLDREPPTEGFVTSEPTREADLFVWFPPDLDPIVAEAAVAEAATWQGVEFSSFWGQDRTLEEFSELFADQPELIAIVENDPSTLSTSVRVWLFPDADRDALAELARQTFPNAVRVGTRDGSAPDESLNTPSDDVTVTTIAAPAELEPAGVALQEEILADEKVTRHEFVRAVSLMAACMIDHGLTGVKWKVDAEGGDWGWSSEYASPTADGTEEAIEQLCYFSYVDPVTRGAWEPAQLPVPVSALFSELEESELQLLDLLSRLHQIEFGWENRRETFAATIDALSRLKDDVMAWADSFAEPRSLPGRFETAYGALVDESIDLPATAEVILVGLQAPDDGTQRKAAVNAFMQEVLDIINAIDAVRRSG